MKGRATAIGVILAAGILGVGYWFAWGRPINHELAFLALVVGFLICDRSFLPRRFR